MRLTLAKFPPPWMTADFLYRINYGPITAKDRSLARGFLIDQYTQLEARRRYKTTSSICRSSWSNLLPGRSPIRNMIGELFPGGVRKESWSRPSSTHIRVMLCFLEPKLVSLVLKHIYSGEEFNSRMDPSSAGVTGLAGA